ncbi:PE-PPE domain-containing protein [Mycobacterium sp. M1]|uniref:PE-PPE domain-containing protein n=2 Tax=Mycolicibacter acidiphilus TaxID=2835306 RepID=A0ABS5RIK0_9MYCO|nr:PE-PPE domain-containing protein [Mycolicibacter acidiphilus]
MVLAGLGAVVVQPVRAEAVLLATEGPLAGSMTALIMGGTTEPTPSPEYARTVEELFLNPLGFNGGSLDSTVCTMDGTDPCSAPLQVLTTPELIQQGPSSLTGASNIVLAVENEFAAHPGAFDADHPLTIFGYSQSATAASIAMERLDALGIDHNALHFVFIGDPSAPTGVWQGIEAAMDATLGKDLTNWLLTTFGMTEVLGNQTPTDLYPATIYSLPDDPVPNWDAVYEKDGLWGGLLSILGPHVEYLGLTPDQVADATTVTDGLLNFVNINGDDINGLQAWLDAVFVGGAANSGIFQSIADSLQLLFTNSF